MNTQDEYDGIESGSQDQRRVRLQKLQVMRENNWCFPNQYKPTIDMKSLLGISEDPQVQEKKKNYALCGRIMRARYMGKAAFLTLQDASGQMQIYIRANDVSQAVFEDIKTWDLGDIIWVKGHVFRTKVGELTLWVADIALLVKSLRPLPDKFHGLQDQETRYRRRYVDLMVNEQSREVFIQRAALIKLMRNFFDEVGYLEVETPMMHPLAGGAVAKPFVTHHNALNMPLYLRIAPELYLKRLVVGGFERVYEINRNFRNEGLSTRHNPEFTMIEFYQAYADYRDLMELTNRLFRKIAEQLTENGVVTYQGTQIDFSKPILEMTMDEAILAYHPALSQEQLRDVDALSGYIRSKNIVCGEGLEIGQMKLHLFEETVEHQLIQPVFITGYPAVVSPLARRSDHDPSVVDRFELFIAGQEVANGFSELNDPIDQDQRFKQQMAEKDKGDEEAMNYDEDYIQALEYGLPPTAGQGIGIDRLVMILTNTPTIRDVILFPTLRPKESH